jgi:L-ribulose-5-phosphate 4-epimerase
MNLAPIPCGCFAFIGGEQIGKVVIESIGNFPVILLKNHGVFTVGSDAESAVKTAVMVDDVARTSWLALQLGKPDEIGSEELKKLHNHYTQEYSQKT